MNAGDLFEFHILTKPDHILGLILDTFEFSSIFGGSWGSIENWLEPKTKP
jgi:hypothetical protein